VIWAHRHQQPPVVLASRSEGGAPDPGKETIPGSKGKL